MESTIFEEMYNSPDFVYFYLFVIIIILIVGWIIYKIKFHD